MSKEGSEGVFHYIRKGDHQANFLLEEGGKKHKRELKFHGLKMPNITRFYRYFMERYILSSRTLFNKKNDILNLSFDSLLTFLTSQ